MVSRSFPWLPVGTEIAGRSIGRVISEGAGYQIVAARGSKDVLLLLRRDASAPDITTAAGAELVEILQPYAFAGEEFTVGAFPEEAAPVRVGDLPSRWAFLTGGDLDRLGLALSKLSGHSPNASWEEALYLRGVGICLPIAAQGGSDRRTLAIRLMTGGVADASLGPRDIARINRWVSEAEAQSFLTALGLSKQSPRREETERRGEFRLKGRPALAAFFQEYVIDYFDRRAEYTAMRIRPPNGILLYGPPGTGKTLAVKTLARHLGWPVSIVDMGGVGSPYIHQTSVMLKRTFDAAAAQAPSILIMDEIDALVGTRSSGTNDHKIEEVAELLRQIETAGDRGILVIGTTNRMNAIDPAILRRGRFDHKIEVGLPSVEEIQDALEGLLAERPTVAGLNVDGAARSLAGRNMADIAWAVDDAARLAVRCAKTAIDDICLRNAVNRLT